jgi:hypothetical protein
MRNIGRCFACAALSLAVATIVIRPASASWISAGSGVATGQTVAEVAPVVSGPTTCTWTTANVLTVTINWTKAAYTTSSVKRADTTTTQPAVPVGSGLGNGATSATLADTTVPHVAPSKGNSTTTVGSYQYTVTNAAGLWTRSAGNVTHRFKLTLSANGSSATCAVV